MSLSLIYIRGHSNLTELCHVILQCWLWILPSCFTIALIDGFLNSPGELLLQRGHTVAPYQRNPFSSEGFSKGLLQDPHFTCSCSKAPLLSALQCQHPVDSRDSPWKELARGSGPCCHFYLLHIFGAVCPLTEILNYWKAKASSYSFVPIVAKAVLSGQAVHIACSWINPAVWRILHTSLGRTGVKISETRAYSISLAWRITGVPDVGHPVQTGILNSNSQNCSGLVAMPFLKSCD